MLLQLITISEDQLITSPAVMYISAIWCSLYLLDLLKEKLFVSVGGEDTQVVLAFIPHFVLGLCQLQEGEGVDATFVGQLALAAPSASADNK